MILMIQVKIRFHDTHDTRHDTNLLLMIVMIDIQDTCHNTHP